MTLGQKDSKFLLVLLIGGRFICQKKKKYEKKIVVLLLVFPLTCHLAFRMWGEWDEMKENEKKRKKKKKGKKRVITFKIIVSFDLFHWNDFDFVWNLMWLFLSFLRVETFFFFSGCKNFIRRFLSLLETVLEFLLFFLKILSFFFCWPMMFSWWLFT